MSASITTPVSVEAKDSIFLIYGTNFQRNNQRKLLLAHVQRRLLVNDLSRDKY